MNKKTIIIALLALVALAANSTVLSSLQWQATKGERPTASSRT